MVQHIICLTFQEIIHKWIQALKIAAHTFYDSSSDKGQLQLFENSRYLLTLERKYHKITTLMRLFSNPICLQRSSF